MKTIADTKSKIHGELASIGIYDRGGGGGGGGKDNLNKNSLCWPLVKAVLVGGRYPNVLRVDLARNQLLAARESNVRFHSSSALHPIHAGKESAGSSHQRNIGNLPFEWIIYEELAKSSRHASVKQATGVSSLSVALFAGSGRFLSAASAPGLVCAEKQKAEDDARNPLTAYLEHLYDFGSDGVKRELNAGAAAASNPQRPDGTLFSVDEWIKFRGTPEAVSTMSFMKTRVQMLVLKRLRNRPFDDVDERLINVVKKILVERENEAVVGENPLAVCYGPPIRGGGGGGGNYNAYGRGGGGGARGYSTYGRY